MWSHQSDRWRQDSESQVYVRLGVRSEFVPGGVLQLFGHKTFDKHGYRRVFHITKIRKYQWSIFFLQFFFFVFFFFESINNKSYICTCFAYGQTGSGKTYTMIGPNGTVSQYFSAILVYKSQFKGIMLSI